MEMIISTDSNRRFRDKLFNDLIEDLKSHKPVDVDFYREWYEELDGSDAIILALARDLYNYTGDMHKYKNRLENLLEMMKN